MRQLVAKLFASVFVFIMLAIYAGPASATVNWPTSVTVDSSSALVGRFSSLALDSTGASHIAYYDVTNLRLKYATNASGVWTTTTLDASATDAGQYCSIAVDSSGKAHISYWRSNGAAYSIYYATNSSGSWEYTSIDTVTSTPVATSIAVDSSSKAHIAYCSTAVKYATNKTGSWITETANAAVPANVSLALDSSGKPHIAYFVASGTSAYYVNKVSASWSTTVLINVIGGNGRLALVVDTTGKAHVAYAQSGIKYEDNTGTNTTWALAATSLDTTADYPTISLDSANKSYVCYNATGGVKMSTNASGTWTATGSGSIIDTQAGTFPSVKLDTAKNAHLSYYNAAKALGYTTQAVTTVTPAITAPTDGGWASANTSVIGTNSFSGELGGKTITGVEVGVSQGGGSYSWYPAATSNGYANWSYSWSPSALGTYSLKARSTDNYVGTSLSTKIGVTADIAAPSVSMTNPTNNGVYIVGGAIVMSGNYIESGSYSSGLSSLKVGIASHGGAYTWYTATAGGSTWSYNWTPGLGVYDVVAKATDNAGNEGITSISTVYVKRSTSVSVSSNSNPSTYGGSVTFTATVAPSAANGWVTFKDGLTALGSYSMTGGTASLTTSSLGVGPHSISIVYAGDDYSQGSTSSTLTQTVHKLTSSTSLMSSPNPSTVGDNVTFTATVSPTTTTGLVSFMDGPTPLGSYSVYGGTATLSTTTLGFGSHDVTAVYVGDGTHSGSSSSMRNQMVLAPVKTASSVSVGSSANPSNFGGSVTLTATVAPTGASGWVTFKDGPTALGSYSLSGGSASTTSSAFSVGDHSITAEYAGDANYEASTSSIFTQTVNKAVTTTSLTSSPNPSTVGGNVTFTATVSPASATGWVSFMDGPTALGSYSMSGGSASFSTSALAVGSHNVTAAYGGDGTKAGSTSSAHAQTVHKGTTSVALGSSVNPSVSADNVTFTASVTPAAATGMVMFKDGSAPLGSYTITGGSVSMDTSSLAVGSHSITAVYSGDPDYTGSTSTILNQVVNKAVSHTSLSSSMSPSKAGQTITLTAIVDPYTSTGSVNFMEGETLLGTAQLSQSKLNGALPGINKVRGGQTARLDISSLSAGDHLITAVYEGDANHNGSASDVYTQTVNLGTLATITLDKTEYVGSMAIVEVTVNDDGINPGPGNDTVTIQTGDETFTLNEDAVTPDVFKGSFGLERFKRVVDDGKVYVYSEGGGKYDIMSVYMEDMYTPSGTSQFVYSYSATLVTGRSMWLREGAADVIGGTGTARADLFAFCAAPGGDTSAFVDTVYLAVTAADLAVNYNNIHSFIADAHLHGIMIEALVDGQTTWMTDDPTPATNMLAAFTTFNSTGAPEERFDGVHMNLPVTQTDWQTNGAVMNARWAIMAGYYDVLGGPNSGMVFATDESPEVAAAGYYTYSDYSVVMMGKDKASGILPDLATISSFYGPLFIGLDTECGKPAGTSFCGQGYAALNTEVGALYSALMNPNDSNNQYMGAAINGYQSYASLTTLGLSLTANTGLTVDEGGSADITTDMLSASEPGKASTDLVFTLTTIPANGRLDIDGSTAMIGDTFTQQDMEDVNLVYYHDGSDTTTDSFSFTVSDGGTGSIGDTTFNITINPVDDTPPSITAPADVTVDSTGVLTYVALGKAYATDAESGIASIVNDAPAGGFPIGQTTVTWTATDVAGNFATATQLVTVNQTPFVVTSLTCNTTYKENAGSVITWTATATGGTWAYEYEFWQYGPATANKWVMVQPYSVVGSWTWITSASDAGSNRVLVKVRGAGQTNAYDATKMSLQPTTVVVPVPPVATAAISCDTTYTQFAGAAIKWTATATGGSLNYEYEFSLYGPSTGNTWVVKKPFSSVDNWTWNTALADIGSNRVKVAVRNFGSTNAGDVTTLSTQITTIKMPPVASATLVSDKPNTNAVGTAVKWTAAGSGGSLSYEYEFSLYGPATGNTWVVKRTYSAVNVWYWNTTAGDIGINRVRVNVRNAGATNASDVTVLSATTITIVATALSSVLTLDSDLIATLVGGTPITWTATGMGGTGSYEYQFSIYNTGTGNTWQVRRAYSTSGVWAWSPTVADIGSTRIKVDIRTQGSGRASDGVKLSAFLANVNPASTPVTSTIDSPSAAATVSGASLPIQVSAYSPNGIATVQARFNNTAYVNCTYNGGTGKWEAMLDPTGFANGIVQYSAIAIDNLGNIRIDTIRVTLNN